MAENEEIIIIDAVGEPCPKPVIMTRKQYDLAPAGAKLKAMVDTPVAAMNVQRAVEEAGGEADFKQEGDWFAVYITKGKKAPVCAAINIPPPLTPHVIYISSDRMGTGDDDLGRILMKAFINTIKDVAPRPSHVIFINTGVFITSSDGPIVDTLKELENSGVTIWSCGTCLNYYKRTEELKAGTISNMFDILNALTGASRVVAP